jgi:CHAT domain-containing protein
LDSNFFSSLKFYREFLSSQAYLSHDTFRISAYCLYQKLLQPFEKEIEDKSLLIIPDGKISLIPFDVLIDEPFQQGKHYYYPTDPYIIRKYPIGYALSASLYVESCHKTHKRRNKILTVAPDFVFSDSSRIEVPRKHLFRLTAFNGKILNSAKATETNFKDKVSGYDIIHVYAHGQEDLNDPAKSKIVLEKDSLNDGLLYAQEVGTLVIHAKLVALASCFSGSGRISEGEGVMSMGRSFISAGASSVVMSLWYTYLEIATEQLWSMQKYLLIGKRKDKALQLAKLKYLDKTGSLSGHPKKWASLIVIGNQAPLYNILPIVVLLSVFSLLTIIAFFLLFKKKRRK